MRLIDVDDVERKIKCSIEWVNYNLEDDRFSQGCKASLKDMLSTIKYYTRVIDAVPVVRCKDCARREVCRTSTVWAVAPNDNWFCADGKRKEVSE